MPRRMMGNTAWFRRFKLKFRKNVVWVLACACFHLGPTAMRKDRDVFEKIFGDFWGRLSWVGVIFLEFWQILTSQVDILVAGFPCISLSPLTTTPGSIRDEGCSSGHGWQSVRRYVRQHRPEVILLENVQTLFHRRKAEGGLTPCLGSVCCDRSMDRFFQVKSK